LPSKPSYAILLLGTNIHVAFGKIIFCHILVSKLSHP
jgi:hypothetical protein